MKYKKRKEIENYREDILLSLPLFINHLLLLLNSGMVLQEAMKSIAFKYEDNGYSNTNLFAREYVKIHREATVTGKNIINSFNDYCKSSQIKELSRLGGILMDSDKRGVDLSWKLHEEAKNLWEQKKRISLEKIRIAESKMSFPLGLLLISLILISAAPAMMQMYI